MTKVFYEAKGTFLNFFWSGKFTYELNKIGFSSRMIEGPLSYKMQGGFIVRPISEESSCVIHYEEYEFTNWTVLLIPLFRYYLIRSMIRELKSINQLLQRQMSSQISSKHVDNENICV